MIGAALATLGVLGGALLIWSGWIEPRWVAHRRYRVPLAGLARPLRVVVAADLQPNLYHWPKARLAKLFAEVQARETPDYVFWVGDYYNGHTDAPKMVLDAHPRLKAWVDQQLTSMADIAAAMAELKGRYGSFGVLGNHDWAWSGRESAAALEAIGIRVLLDETVLLEDAIGPVAQLQGYEDIASGRLPNFARLHGERRGDLPVIVLSHTPDAFPADAAGGASLMISGHTHGGQVRVPGIGPLLLPIQHSQYDRGWFTDGARRLFVTVGIGTSLPPVRFAVRPEIVVLDLVPEDEDG